MSFAFSKLLDTLEVIKKQKRKTGNARILLVLFKPNIGNSNKKKFQISIG
jgi:hypothetical protein